MPGRRFKAVQIGGPSGGCVPAKLADTPVDYESLRDVGAIMGSGGLVVLDDTACMVDIARYFLQFTQDQSCGKCTFCRVGTRRMLDILDRLCLGKGQKTDLAELGNLAAQVGARGADVGRATANVDAAQADVAKPPLHSSPPRKLPGCPRRTEFPIKASLCSKWPCRPACAGSKPDDYDCSAPSRRTRKIPARSSADYPSNKRGECRPWPHRQSHLGPWFSPTTHHPTSSQYPWTNRRHSIIDYPGRPSGGRHSPVWRTWRHANSQSQILWFAPRLLRCSNSTELQLRLGCCPSPSELSRNC